MAVKNAELLKFEIFQVFFVCQKVMALTTMQKFFVIPVHECRSFILNQLRVTLISHYHKWELKCIRMQIESLGSLRN